MVPVRRLGHAARVRGGTVAEHLACRSGAVVFDVSHLGTVRVSGRDVHERLQRALHQRPRQDRAGAGAVHPPARRGRRLGARRHHRVVGRRTTFDVMPNASNTDRVRAAIGGEETTATRAVLAVQGPEARAAAGHRARPTAAAVGRFRVARVRRGRASSSPWPAPATPARTASRSRCRPAPPPDCGGGTGRRRGRPPGSAPATRCGSKPRCRCTATSSAPASRRCRPGWAGWWRGTSRAFRGRAALEAERDAACAGCCGASRPTAGARPRAGARC